ncbi:hypothetical protein [Mycolicibacterium sp.]|uniref:hypothetical protein n=1 Tax=Mycolicibacterium sp. TaxID=2320850 RepID=UPI0025F3E966|nr:hypothetical protein [Mycolicibacterium sp.]MCB9409874.1 hypothetical protein [Mycolicibacterium sp.]
MNLVAFIDSPLQALNLLEYSKRFSREVDVVVVGDVAEPESCSQIEAVLSLLGPKQIIQREWMLRPAGPHRAQRSVASGVAALRSHLPPGPHEFIVGEYRSAFSWAVLHRLKDLARNVVVVDDGTAMLRIDRQKSIPRSREQWRLQLKRLIFLALGIRGIVPRSDLTFFTSFAINDRVAPGDTVIRNDYRTLSSELRELPPDEDSVYVIGGPYLEGGDVDQGDVELALELIGFAADYTGKEVIYMAHRRERAEKLNVLRREVTVVTPDVPFEIYPRVIGRRPRFIVGYYSSVFVTAAELLGNAVDIIALEMPRHQINSSWLPFIDAVYEYYRTELPTAIRIVDRPNSFRDEKGRSGQDSS